MCDIAVCICVLDVRCGGAVCEMQSMVCAHAVVCVSSIRTEISHGTKGEQACLIFISITVSRTSHA